MLSIRRAAALVLMLFLAACTGTEPETGRTPQPSATPSASPTTSVAEKRLWALVERSKADGPDTVNAGLARIAISGGASVKLPIGTSDDHRFHVSRDGSMFGRTVRTRGRVQLWSGPTNDVTSFKRLTEHDVDAIPSLLWSDDGAHLYYVTLVFEQARGDASREKLWRIPARGGPREVVADYGVSDAPYVSHDLLGFTEDGSGIVWATAIGDGLGSIEEAGVTDIATGTTRQIGSDLGAGGDDGVALSADGRTLYWVRDRRTLLARSIVTGADRRLYVSKEKELRALTSGSAGVVFQDTTIDLGGDTASAGDETVTLVAGGPSVREIVRARGAEADFVVDGWSPDGRYLWFGSSFVHSSTTSGERMGRAKVRDLDAARWIPMDESEDIARTFIGWFVLDE